MEMVPPRPHAADAGSTGSCLVSSPKSFSCCAEDYVAPGMRRRIYYTRSVSWGPNIPRMALQLCIMQACNLEFDASAHLPSLLLTRSTAQCPAIEGALSSTASLRLTKQLLHSQPFFHSPFVICFFLNHSSSGVYTNPEYWSAWTATCAATMLHMTKGSMWVALPGAPNASALLQCRCYVNDTDANLHACGPITKRSNLCNI